MLFRSITLRSLEDMKYSVFSSIITLPILTHKLEAFSTYRQRTVMAPSSHFVSPSTLKDDFVSVEESIAAFNAHAQEDSDDTRPKLVFVDGSWYVNKDRSSRKEYEAGPRIAGATYFDIDDVSSKGPLLNPKNLPHMMPPKHIFASVMDALGISNHDSIVVYGKEGCLFSTRAWYTFREMGHSPEKVHLMQGTLQDWIDQGGKVDCKHVLAVKVDDLDLNQPTEYHSIDSTSMVNMDMVRSIVSGQSNGIILDARSEGRFKGTAPEPRPGLRGGRMPNSINVPATDLLDGAKYLPVEQLKAVFEKAGISTEASQKIICSCGSGVTACVIAAALQKCGRDPKHTYIFDGSWIEWASDLSNPVE